MRWLHITDLHIGRDNPSQGIAMRELITAIASEAADVPFDAVLLTGDIAYSGRRDEYLRVVSEVIQPFRSMPLFSKTRFVAVPGNHDIDCNLVLPISWDTFGPQLQERFLHDTADGALARKSRTMGFQAFSEFASVAALEGVDPCGRVATTVEFATESAPIVIHAVVTAFFSYARMSDQNKTPAPTEPLRAEMQKYNKARHRLVIGHHPISWFTSDTQGPFKELLSQHSAVYIHGHEHLVTVDWERNGLRSLGFGAVYVEPIDRPNRSRYENSFAICDLDDLLHIRVVSWDATVGRWYVRTNLPELTTPSSRLASAYEVPLPSTMVKYQFAADQKARTSAGAIIPPPRDVVWLCTPRVERWAALLEQMRLIDDSKSCGALDNPRIPKAAVDFIAGAGRKPQFVRAIAAPTHVTSHEDVVTLNAIIDAEGLHGALVMTLGSLAEDARTVAQKLATRKSLTVKEGAEAIEAFSATLTPSLRRVLAEEAPEACHIRLLVLETGVGAIVADVDSSAWFVVLDPMGVLEASDSETVRLVRDRVDAVRRVPYGRISTGSGAPGRRAEGNGEFDVKKYMEECYVACNEVRYAALAAMGVRLSDPRLESMYVAATAEVADGAGSPDSLLRTIDGVLETLGVEDSYRDYFEARIREQLGTARTVEVSSARKLYQRYENVLVLGDPGSGKSCFVKSEILAYCRPRSAGMEWYKNHVPVYVALAEASRIDAEGVKGAGFISAAARRRGPTIPEEDVDRLLRSGSAAVFFDGLDEIAAGPARLATMKQVQELVTQYGKYGNRFVLTSRPAVFAGADHPRGFSCINLRGLSDDQRRQLAENVLAIRATGDRPQSPGAHEHAVIEKLLSDCIRVPGIGRMARNPLLLTLLAVVYANAGGASARRHRVYAESVQTLVSVRNRNASGRVLLSETDLRRRLGALALCITRGSLAEIPVRDEVLRVLAPLMPTGPGCVNAAASFLQEAAEITGLLTLHPRIGGDGGPAVTFMHYSFLEYYAAAGLMFEDYIKLVPSIATNPRWHEIVTLHAGMVGDTHDVTPLISGILTADDPSERVTGGRLLVAIECALECDAPPEDAEIALAAAVGRYMSHGVGRISSDYREALAERLARLLSGVGAARVQAVLRDGLGDTDPVCCAAFSDILGRVAMRTNVSGELVSSFESACARKDAVVLVACCGALERASVLRTTTSVLCIERAVKGAIPARHAALRAIEAIPGAAALHRGTLLKLVEDRNGVVSGLAARCLLAGEASRPGTIGDDHEVGRCIARWEKSIGADADVLAPIRLTRRRIEQLMATGKSQDLMSAIRMLAATDGDDPFVHDAVIGILRSGKAHEVEVAALDALRGAWGARELVTLAEASEIATRTKSEHRDVRMAAIMLMRRFPPSDEMVDAAFSALDRARQHGRLGDEFRECVGTVVVFSRLRDDVRDRLLGVVLERLPRPKGKFGDEKSQVLLERLLGACEELGTPVGKEVVARVEALAGDYRVPIRIRCAAVRALGAIAPVSRDSVRWFESMLRQRHAGKFERATYLGMEHLVGNIAKDPSRTHGIAVELRATGAELLRRWDVESRQSRDTIDDVTLRSMRETLTRIQTFLNVYEEQRTVRDVLG